MKRGTQELEQTFGGIFKSLESNPCVRYEISGVTLCVNYPEKHRDYRARSPLG